MSSQPPRRNRSLSSTQQHFMATPTVPHPGLSSMDANGSPNMLSTPQPPSRLFTLPPELRNMIYTLVVLPDEFIIISANGKTSRPPPPITRASRQCRNEALPIFYATKFVVRFTPEQPNGAKIWTTFVVKQSCKWLQYVDILLDVEVETAQDGQSVPDTLRYGDPVISAIETMIKHGTPAASIKVAGTVRKDGYYGYPIFLGLHMLRRRLNLREAYGYPDSLQDIRVEGKE